MKQAMILIVIGVMLLALGCSTEQTEEIKFPSDEQPEDSVMAQATGNVYQVVIEGSHEENQAGDLEYGRAQFMPDSLEIGVGDTVEWVNTDDFDHTVTFDNGVFDDVLRVGSSTSYIFTEAGVNTYLCGFHSEMQGIVIVS